MSKKRNTRRWQDEPLPNLEPIQLEAFKTAQEHSLDATPDESASFRHYPVLYREIITAAKSTKAQTFFDGTLGEAGHLMLFAENFPDAHFYASDADPEMLARLNQKQVKWPTSLQILYGNFWGAALYLKEQGVTLDFALLDLGVSEFHFSGMGRGFSFNDEASLDMRLNPSYPYSAADVLNGWTDKQLAALFWQYSEERWAIKIAAGILEFRKTNSFESSTQLAELVETVVPKRFWGKIHPSTRVLQALRIWVNQELNVLERAIMSLHEILAEDGILAIISFHSLEDRIVKHQFREITSQNTAFSLPSRKPIIPTDVEIAENKKSRSAKLRLLQNKDAKKSRNKYRN